MSLLTLIQDTADITGVPRPTAVLSSTDTQVRQLLSLANREGRSLQQRHDWTVLQKTATLVTLAAEEQGAIASIAADYDRQANESIWNRSQQERVGGPLTPIDWQLLQAATVSGPYQDFRISEGKLFFYPAPPAGETVAFDYVSKNWCQSAGGTGQSRWGADDDIGILSEDLMHIGIVWRWKQQKGMDYAEDFRTYETELAHMMARDGGRRVLSMDEDAYEYYPTIRAPVGSWAP